jgi:uroporphyrinogen III methyltransferase/synthase
LTLRGAELLARAQVVVYDSLANPALLDHAPQAERVYVGKRAAAHSVTQDQINHILIDHATRGKMVVRLKGGDPYVFGRGGEECEALRAAGISFEVVPGITSAIAAPAYAGIPVTHRNLNSSFTLVTGHEKEEPYKDEQARARGAAAGSSDVDWSVLAKLPCLAFYMGVKSLGRICQKLIDHGMSPDMPAATIRWGTRADQRTITGTLATLPGRVAEAGIAPPAMTIVGRVVGLREQLNWFELRPLFGQSIVVTRTRHQASALGRQLAELGARVIEAPTIDLLPPADWTEIDQTLLALDSASHFPTWLLFTSPNGVRAARERLRALKRDVRLFAGMKIGAVGQATADAIANELSLHVDLCPESATADALADALDHAKETAGRRFLLLRADIARPALAERLKQAGAAEVVDLAIYQTVAAPALPAELLEAMEHDQVHWITFTSSSTARNFLTLLPERLRPKLQQVQIASIGPQTTQTLRELGLPPTVQPAKAAVEDLIAAIVEHSKK